MTEIIMTLKDILEIVNRKKVKVSLRNPNHPKKGDCIKVEPIRNLEDIGSIKKMLETHPRDLLLFTLGINTNLRASDLVRLTIEQVKHLSPLEDLEIREKKTRKMRRISLNKTVIDTIAKFIGTLPDDIKGKSPLFPSQRGEKSLTVSSVHRLVKGWCHKAELRGNYGSHTLRKTLGISPTSHLWCWNSYAYGLLQSF